MNTKMILGVGAVVIIGFTILLFTLERAEAPAVVDTATTTPVTELSPVATTTATTSTSVTPPVGKLKVANFTGKLGEVNTGCFSDGECYVVVDGKHITVLRGWSQDTVGSIQGAPSIGDFESMIGSTIEVYAKDNTDGTYTLYGSEGFYIKVTKAVKSKPITSTNTTPPIASGKCIVGGCSSQLCVDESAGEMASTCEYREAYACYKTATCERQSSGQCGWTATPELKACIAAS